MQTQVNRILLPEFLGCLRSLDKRFKIKIENVNRYSCYFYIPCPHNEKIKEQSHTKRAIQGTLICIHNAFPLLETTQSVTLCRSHQHVDTELQKCLQWDHDDSFLIFCLFYKWSTTDNYCNMKEHLP